MANLDTYKREVYNKLLNKQSQRNAKHDTIFKTKTESQNQNLYTM